MVALVVEVVEIMMVALEEQVVQVQEILLQ